jgi:hypothetical protein
MWADWKNNGPDWYARDDLHHNLDVIVRESKAAALTVACWGAIAWDEVWIDHVVEEITTGEEPWKRIYCFGTTSSGAPIHPLARGKHRIPDNAEPVLWRSL